MDFPLGHTAGPPGDRVTQAAIVRAAVECLETASRPGVIVDLDVTWAGGHGWRQDEGGETRKARVDIPQYQHDDDRVAAEVAHHYGRCTSCIGIDG